MDLFEVMILRGGAPVEREEQRESLPFRSGYHHAFMKLNS
jgi:hypothetical protein